MALKHQELIWSFNITGNEEVNRLIEQNKAPEVKVVDGFITSMLYHLIKSQAMMSEEIMKELLYYLSL